MATNKFYTTGDVATTRNCHRATVSRVAGAHGIGQRIGRDWLFTPAEYRKICRLIRDAPGNPAFSGKKGAS